MNMKRWYIKGFGDLWLSEEYTKEDVVLICVRHLKHFPLIKDIELVG